MPLYTSWFIPSRVLLVKAVGAIQDEEVLAADKNWVLMLDQAEPEHIHFFYDASEQTTAPGVKTMSKIQLLQHPKLLWSVHYGSNSKIVNMTGAFISQLRGMKVQFVTNQQEAVQFLLGVDDQLKKYIK